MTWQESAQQDPELAALGQERLDRHGLVMVATLRKNGWPRISPVEPLFHNGQLYLGMMWRMGCDVGLDKYGKGLDKFVSWGYLPHEEKYNKPTIESRNHSIQMPSGVFDGATGTHKLMDQAMTREDVTHAW